MNKLKQYANKPLSFIALIPPSIFMFDKETRIQKLRGGILL